MNEIDIYVKNNDKDKITDILNNYLKNDVDKLIYKTDLDGSFNYHIDKFSKHARAFLKIQDGCNNYCSYCKIPFARGNSRSKKTDFIINDIKNIINNGYKEIVLTGINLGSYYCENNDFDKLLSIITDEFKNIRFRISSIEPQYITNNFLKVYKKDNICPHLHIPLQSGSNKILKLMNRKYTTDFYRKIIEEVRGIKPDTFVSTDLILGFPGEDNNDFIQIKDFIEQNNFSYIHLFGFSARKGTKAFNLKPKIPERIRDERINEIYKIMKKNNLNCKNKFLNKKQQVIIERKKSDYYTGKSENYLDIFIKTDRLLNIKEIYNVKIIKINDDKIFGDLL